MADIELVRSITLALTELRRDGSGGAFDEHYGLIHQVRNDSKELIPVLHDTLLSDTNPEALVFALDALKKLDADLTTLVPALTNCLRKNDSDVRSLAVRLLAGVGPGARDAVPQLVQLAKDPGAYVSTRLLAVWGLRRILGTWYRTFVKLRGTENGT